MGVDYEQGENINFSTIIHYIFGRVRNKKSVSTEFFETNANYFECVAEFLNEESPCLEITTDRPPLFSNEKYKKIEKLFYIYDETAPKLEEKYIEDMLHFHFSRKRF